MQDNDNRYVAAFELKGKDVTLKIAEIKSESVEGGKSAKKRKVIIYFDGAKKPLLSNTTNNKTIASLYGSNADAWVGKLVTIYPTTCDAFGESGVECIRVRPMVPQAVTAGSVE